MCDMRAQLLTFQNGVFSQDLCYRVITRSYRIIVASRMILRLLQQNKATRMAKLTSFARAITWNDWKTLYINSTIVIIDLLYLLRLLEVNSSALAWY